MTRTSKVTLVLAMALLGGACSKKPQPTVAPVAEAAPRVDDAEARRREAEERARREAEEARRREELARAQAMMADLVFFDYDSFDIRSDSRPVLDSKIPLLRTSPEVRLRINGHTDERGSEEYNIALGMRRAQAAKEYLVGFGLDASRFDVFSFGEERPLEEGASESVMSRNRRADFQITGGTLTVR